MKIDGTQSTGQGLEGAASQAAQLEALGYDGFFCAEINHDPFLPLVLAAEHTSRLEIGSSIAVAFPRSPMQVAHVGHDLQRFSSGRFILGLGSQVRAHVERRFSASFDRPAPRLREFVLAVRAIWDSWESATPLRFEGEFFRHTLMTPMFDPGPTGFGTPQVFVAGVGPRMTEVAGEVCDGFFAHSFSTRRYLEEVTLPALAAGMQRSGRHREQFEVAMPVLVATGSTAAAVAEAERAVRGRIAFYCSTPAYEPVLRIHGLEKLGVELHELSRRGDWKAMAALVPDDLVGEVALVGTPSEVAEAAARRFHGLIDRISFSTPYEVDSALLGEIGQRIRTAVGADATPAPTAVRD